MAGQFAETVEVMKSGSSMELAQQDLTSGKDGIPLKSTITTAPSEDQTSNIKVETDNKSVGEHGLSYTPASCYSNYYYPGYNGNFAQMDGYYQADGSYTGMQSDDGSMVYYMPGYNPYATRAFPGVSYGSEAMPCYSWDSTFSRDGKSSKSSVKSNGANTTKTNGNVSSKFSKPVPHTHTLKPLNKVSHPVSDYSAGFLKGVHPLGRYSSLYNQRQGSLPNYGSIYKQNGRTWSGNDRFRQKDKPFKNLESNEITRGPRINGSAPSNSLIVKDLGLTVSRDHYNLPDFEIEYENAKFYVIKSFSEDNVHKCIKYSVWSSTANGNKKLDAAFHGAEARASEKGTKCPVFLFFSVNGSGQFIGCAEMIGNVDFNKDMDFWQLDKWNGFFPVKWHIVKDIPNSQLRHIILENNDNKDVTYTRDTQEVGLKQGLEMLKIFKNYTAKTSLLDDFNFYEVREKSGRAKLSSRPTAAARQNETFMVAGESQEMKTTCDSSSLVDLTKKLNLDSVKVSMEN